MDPLMDRISLMKEISRLKRDTQNNIGSKISLTNDGTKVPFSQYPQSRI